MRITTRGNLDEETFWTSLIATGYEKQLLASPRASHKLDFDVDKLDFDVDKLDFDVDKLVWNSWKNSYEWASLREGRDDIMSGLGFIVGHMHGMKWVWIHWSLF